MGITIKRGSHKTGNNQKQLKIFLILACFLILFFFSISFASAVDIEMNESFSQGQTLIAKISGNFVDALTINNLFFYRNHVRVPMTFNIVKIDSDYHIYSQLSDKQPGNYSFQIRNVRYYQAGKISSDAIIKNFTIINEIADFYLSPGFIKTDKDFSVELTNLQDKKIKVEVVVENVEENSVGFLESLFGGSTDAGSGKEQTIELSSGQTKKVNFDFENLTENINEPVLTTISLKSENTSYFVPLFLDIKEPKAKTDNDGAKLRFEPSIMNISLATNSTTTRIIYLYNDGNNTAENVSLSISKSLIQYINVSLKNISEIDDNSSAKIELFISSNESEENLFGQLIAEYKRNNESVYKNLDIYLNFIEDYIPINNDTITVINSKTCSELNGTICASDATCSGEYVAAYDGSCCLATCVAPEKNQLGTYVGWILIGLVVLILVWFFSKKYKRAGNKAIDLLKVAQGKK